MQVVLYDADGCEDSQQVGDTKDGVPIPRVGECVYGLNPKIRGTVEKVSYHYDRDCVFVYVKRI